MKFLAGKVPSPPEAQPASAERVPADLTNESGLGKAEAPVASPRAAQATLRSPAVKKRILFVESETGALPQLATSLQSMEGEWAMSFLESGEEALEFIGKQSSDVVVSGLRLAGMDGIDFLNEVGKQHPKTLRFMRCEPEERGQIKKCSGIAPQLLNLQSDAETLIAGVKRALLLEALMSDEPVKRLISQIHKLPSLPLIYNQVLEELQSPMGSIDQVAAYISKDFAMTAKMLQLANSAFFSFSREIADIKEAVLLLGVEKIKALFFFAHVFSQLDQAQSARFSWHALWLHSVGTGVLAKSIVQSEQQNPKMAEEAFTAGLLHDIGKLMLAVHLPGQYRQVLATATTKGITQWEAEREVFGATHAELGACLLGIWGLPLAILEAIAWHHSPEQSENRNFSLLTAVHVANALEYEKQSDKTGRAASQVNTTYLTELGCGDRLDHWRKLCGGAKSENG